jgi:catalase
MLIAEGFDGVAAEIVRKALVDRGAIVEVIAPVLGMIAAQDGSRLEADKTYKTGASVFYDALFVPGGEACVAELDENGDAIHFLQEAYKHGKAIAAIGEAVELVGEADIDTAPEDDEAAAGEGESESEEGSARGEAVVSQDGVVTCWEPAQAAEMVVAFVAAIAAHRHWDREIAAISA